MFSKKSKTSKWSDQYRVDPDFKEDMTPIESAHITRFYFLSKMLDEPATFDRWDLIKRHFKIVKRTE